MNSNKYARVEMPKLKVLKPGLAMTRKDKRRIYFGRCPCGSRKAYHNCCLPKDREERRKRGLEDKKKT